MPEIGVGLSLSESIQILTLVLVIATGMLSYQSIVIQRRARMREAIEQLDQMKFDEAGDWKVKAVLHDFNSVFWKRKKTEVKLHLYVSIDPPNLSHPAKSRPKFSGEIFTGQNELHDYENVGNGYVVTFESTDPLYVRRETDYIMARMWNAIYEGEASFSN